MGRSRLTDWGCALCGPGPWKDDPIDIAQDPEAQKQKQMREEGVLTLLKRKDLVGKVQDIEVPSLLRRVVCVVWGRSPPVVWWVWLLVVHSR